MSKIFYYQVCKEIDKMIEHNENPDIKFKKLRDDFAGLAMQSCIIGYREPKKYAESIAIQAYEIADAMLKERLKQK